MSNISEKHKLSLQSLIYSYEIKNVIQGLELLDSLIEDKKDVYFVFDFKKKIPTSIEELEASLSNVKHRNYIKLWILGKLAEVGVHWSSTIEILDLTNNYLSSLPMTMTNLKELRSLNVTDNYFSVLPKCIAYMQNLKILNCTRCYLSSLSLCISELTQLTQLILNENSFASFPKVIKIMPSLSDVHLSENEITCLPENIGEYTNLRFLYQITINSI
jgi:Leucine-rich repeat (LRR) protein